MVGMLRLSLAHHVNHLDPGQDNPSAPGGLAQGARAEKTAFRNSGRGGKRYSCGGLMRLMCKKAVVIRQALVAD